MAKKQISAQRIANAICDANNSPRWHEVLVIPQKKAGSNPKPQPKFPKKPATPTRGTRKV